MNDLSPSSSRCKKPSSTRANDMNLLTKLFAVIALASPVYGSSMDVTGPDYGLLIVSFLFLMGVSQVGVVFCAICRLVYAQWAKPFYRLAELSTMAFAPFAVIGFILIFMYEQELFYWLNTSADLHLSGITASWLTSDGLLYRNLYALLAFYGLSWLYVSKGVKQDRSDQEEIQQRKVERQLFLMSPWVIAAFVLCNTFIAWDFAMMIVPASHGHQWVSSVFPIHFWFGSVFAGTAALIAFPALLGKGDTSPFNERHIRQLSTLVTAFTLLWLYFYWAQFFVIWFGNMPHEFEPLWRQMYGHYAPYYWTMISGCFFIPLAALIFAVFNRSTVAMCAVAVSICVGAWVNKYLMIIPVFSDDARLSDSLGQLGLSIVLALAFVSVVYVLAKRYSVYSNWEMSLSPNPDR